MKMKMEKRLIEMCSDKRLVIGNTWFKKRKLHKYTWVSGVNGDKALLDYVCVQKSMRGRLIDVNVLRGAGLGLSDHFLMEAKLRVKAGWGRHTCVSKTVEIIKVGKLEEEICAKEYRRVLKERWESIKESELVGVEEEWGRFKNSLKEVVR